MGVWLVGEGHIIPHAVVLEWLVQVENFSFSTIQQGIDRINTDAGRFRRHRVTIAAVNVVTRDYSIVGSERAHALAFGLADATWYVTPVPREEMRSLMQRRDGPALRDTALWFGLLGGFGYLAHLSFGTWWMIAAFFVYATLYASVSDSRWHECAHRTAFKTDWLNDVVYYVASFMVWREGVSWRWSHVRHHSDTIIVGRDPEIAFQRPMTLRKPLLEFFGLASNPGETMKILGNAVGRLSPDELDYVPRSEWHKVVLSSRIYVAIWVTVVGFAIGVRSIEPLLLIGGPSFFGKWLLVAYGITQHAGLAEDSLDHRLNSRSVRMNRLHRYLYWNMNFHIEHHMFPTVPFHALPALHEAVKADYPPMISGFRSAYAEIFAVYRRQKKEPNYFLDRSSLLPTQSGQRSTSTGTNTSGASEAGWIDAGPASALVTDDVIRFDDDDRTYAIYRLGNGEVRATDGRCTHADVHLCDGLVRDGIIECPKHNGRFDITTGKAVGRPAKIDLTVYEVREQNGRIELRLNKRTGPV